MNTEEIKELWGEELFDAFADHIDEEGFLTNDWADILEKKYPDHTFYDKPEIKENIYSRMYNLDAEENAEGTKHRPVI